MIPNIFIEQWRNMAPWQLTTMVEQDLVISRALVALYNQEIIKNSLLFRGGTALNKLYLEPAARYSEDIDLVQINSAPIGNIINVIRSVLDDWLGEPKRKLTNRSVKLIYTYQSVSNTPQKLKIEINTTEHFHVRPIKNINYSVSNPWFTGDTLIATYQLDELLATKLRALYQRRKGRDLFDLWLFLDKKLINPLELVEIFYKYAELTKQPINKMLFEKNLAEKLAHKDFNADMNILLAPGFDWRIHDAAKIVNEQLILRL